MYLLLEFQNRAALRHVDFFRPPSSTPETGVSYASDFNWKWTKTLIWRLYERSAFAKLSLRVKFPAGERVTGRPKCGGTGSVSALPAVVTGSPVATGNSSSLQYWDVPSPKEMPLSSVAPFSHYPSTLLLVLKSQFLQHWRSAWAKDGLDGDWDDPKYSHWQKQREGAIHTLCLDYKQGDTKWHRFLGCHYFSYRPRLSGLLICLCFLSVVFSISGCCSRDLPSPPGWYALYPEQQWAEVCSKTLMWIFQFKTLQLLCSEET